MKNMKTLKLLTLLFTPMLLSNSLYSANTRFHYSNLNYDKILPPRTPIGVEQDINKLLNTGCNLGSSRHNTIRDFISILVYSVLHDNSWQFNFKNTKFNSESATMSQGQTNNVYYVSINLNDGSGGIDVCVNTKLPKGQNIAILYHNKTSPYVWVAKYDGSCNYNFNDFKRSSTFKYQEDKSYIDLYAKNYAVSQQSAPQSMFPSVPQSMFPSVPSVPSVQTFGSSSNNLSVPTHMPQTAFYPDPPKLSSSNSFNRLNPNIPPVPSIPSVQPFGSSPNSFNVTSAVTTVNDPIIKQLKNISLGGYNIGYGSSSMSYGNTDIYQLILNVIKGMMNQSYQQECLRTRNPIIINFTNKKLPIYGYFDKATGLWSNVIKYAKDKKIEIYVDTRPQGKEQVILIHKDDSNDYDYESKYSVDLGHFVSGNEFSDRYPKLRDKCTSLIEKMLYKSGNDLIIKKVNESYDDISDKQSEHLMLQIERLFNKHNH